MWDMQDKLTVIYNGSCPICSREVAGYRARADREQAEIAFVDLTAEETARFGLSRDDAARQFHVLRDGRLVAGLDAFILLWDRLPGLRWLAKAELFKIPIFGASMKGAGYISIDRSDRKSAFESLDRAANLIRNGTSVLIFPEGTRSWDGQLLPFKKGGFVLAADAGVPIIPIIITGTHHIMPKKGLLIQRRPVVMEVLPAVETAPYNRNTKDDLMAKVRETMLSASTYKAEGGLDA